MIGIIFRKDKTNENVIAFFRESFDGEYIDTYEHIGQHSSASYSYYLNNTIPCNEEDYKGLLKELKDIGYEDIKMYKRLMLNKPDDYIEWGLEEISL